MGEKEVKHSWGFGERKLPSLPISLAASVMWVGRVVPVLGVMDICFLTSMDEGDDHADIKNNRL